MVAALALGDNESMHSVDIAWVAGILEGEGCFTVAKDHRSGKSYPHIALRMSDQDVVRRLRDVTGYGRVRGPLVGQADKKLMYSWDVGRKNETAALLLAIYPLMGERRRERIGQLVGLLDTYRGRSEATCPHGHQNYRLNGKGHKVCRDCLNARLRRYRAQQREKRSHGSGL